MPFKKDKKRVFNPTKVINFLFNLISIIKLKLNKNLIYKKFDKCFINADLFPKDQYPEDWNQWSAWTSNGGGSYSRNRTCKNSLFSGKCRGVSRQTKTVSVSPGVEGNSFDCLELDNRLIFI